VNLQSTPNHFDKCVVLCCDDNYLPFARTLVKDLTYFSPRYPIYVLTPKGSQISKLAPFENIVNFIEVEIEKHSNYLNKSSHISLATYLRLFIPDFLPANVNHFLYLDIDLLLLSSIDELFSFETNFAFSLVPAGGKLTHHPLLENLKKVFYGGVMLVNRQKWNSENVTQKCIRLAREHGPFANQDNDLLLLIADEIGCGELPTEYNVMYYQEAASMISIVHFPGTQKPWNSYHGGKFARVWRERYRVIEPNFQLGLKLYVDNTLTWIKNKLYTFALEYRNNQFKKGPNRIID
jgi:lipopolysaccharide biosynthesis glycosyltransferase